MNLLITYPIAEELVRRIKDMEIFASVSYHPSTFVANSKHPRQLWNHEPATISDQIWAQTDVLMTMFVCPESKAHVPRLKFIQGMSAGLEHMLHARYFQEVQQAGDDVKVCTGSGVHSTKIGEYVLMQTLSVYTRLPFLLEHAKKQRWDRQSYVPPGKLSGSQELRGKTMGIIGYGCIGRECARLASAFGMSILAASSSGKKASGRGFVIPGTGDQEGNLPQAWSSTLDEKSLDSFLKQVDVLVLACPLTPATKHLINTKTLKSLKSSAIIINIARGGLQDHDALIKALEEDRLGAACLDVTDPEPLPDNHPLWTTKNCFVTPHIAGATEYYASRCVDLLEENLNRWQSNQTLLNPVNLQKGY